MCVWEESGQYVCEGRSQGSMCVRGGVRAVCV